MPIIKLSDTPVQDFPNGASYHTIVGDDEGSTPVRVGVQVSPPGYSTGTHSHPYMEVVSVIDGEGEAWMDGVDDLVKIGPGDTVAVPPGVKHGFRATGDKPLRTYGVHASPDRIVHRHPEEDQ